MAQINPDDHTTDEIAKFMAVIIRETADLLLTVAKNGEVHMTSQLPPHVAIDYLSLAIKGIEQADQQSKAGMN